MKQTLLLILLLLLTVAGYAQKQDSISTEALLEKAVTLEDDDPQKKPLLEECIAKYEAAPFTEKRLEAMGLLAYAYLYEDNDKVKVITDQISELIAQYQVSELSPSLFYHFRTLQGLYTSVDPKEAVRYGEQAIAIMKEPSEEYFVSRYMLSVDYISLGRFDKAKVIIEELEEQIVIATDQEFDRYKVPVFMSKMSLFQYSHKYEQAIAYGQQALLANQIYKEVPTPYEGGILFTIGSCYFNLRQHEKSIDMVQQAIERYGYEPNNPYNSPSYNLMAQNYEFMGEYDQAIELYKKAISGALKEQAYFGGALSTLYSNCANCYLKTGELLLAEEAIQESFKFETNRFNYDIYGLILTQKGAYSKALEVLQKALKETILDFDPQKLEDNPDLENNLSDAFWVGQMLSKKSQTWLMYGVEEQSIAYIQNAIETAQLAIEIHNQETVDLNGFQTTQLARNRYLLNTYTTLTEAHYELYQLTQEEAWLAKLFEVSDQQKIMSLAKNLTDVELPRAFLVLEDSLVKQRNFYEQKLELAQTDSTAYYQERLFEVSVALEAYFVKLKDKYPQYYNDYYEIAYTNIQDLRAQLAASSLLLQYTFVEDGLLIQTIDTEEHIVKKVEVSEKVAKDIDQLKTLLSSPLLAQTKKREAFIEASHRLYELLIAPVAEQLKGKEKIMIVPEEELFYIPFEVLLATDEKRSFNELDFLVKQYEINYHYSATAFVNLQTKASIEDQSFLAFAPVFEGGQPLSDATRSMDFVVDSLYRSINENSFMPLLNTEIEVNSIAGLLPKSANKTILLKTEATENKLSTSLSAQPYQFVHIATHGLVNYINPKLSALACHMESTEQDGLYFANEIQAQNIQADLVVLSSCESGIGQLIAGEGLVALNRSFIYSGARNVLFSLWKVDDAYTKDLMIDFYRNYTTQNSTYTNALREAKLHMLADPATASPRYWASFVLMGE